MDSENNSEIKDSGLNNNIRNDGTSRSGLNIKQTRSHKKRNIFIVLFVLVILLTTLASVAWYSLSLKPISDSENATKKSFRISQNETFSTIAKNLEDEGLIRSALAISIYARLHGEASNLQAGVFSLSSDQSTQEILSALKRAPAEDKVITFYPGAVLTDPRDISDAQRTDVVTMLKRAGYSEAEIDKGLSGQYDHPLFSGKPENTTLEGYIYGETYHFDLDATVEEVLNKTFEQYYKALEDTSFIEAAENRDLSLYEAITLASIVQREVSDPDDQKKVAQVFFNRLSVGMALGSDVTFIYAADQANVQRAVDLDSPYNTRIYTGLPPGPIATPGFSALEAVASPTDNDYLYFVAGDDGNTYFGKTEAEHEANIAAYCHKLCSEL